MSSGQVPKAGDGDRLQDEVAAQQVHREVVHICLGHAHPHLGHEPIGVLAVVIAGRVDNGAVARLLGQLDGDGHQAAACKTSQFNGKNVLYIVAYIESLA